MTDDILHSVARRELLTGLGTLAIGGVSAALVGREGLARAAPADAYNGSGRVLSTDLTTGTAVTTLLTGKTFSVDATTWALTDGVSSATSVTSKDNLTNAGIVHVTNGVLQHN